METLARSTPPLDRTTTPADAGEAHPVARAGAARETAAWQGEQLGTSQRPALGVFSLLLAAVWGILFVYVALPSLPYNPIRPPRADLVKLHSIVPQGWAFFTRDPREARNLAFRRAGEGWVSALWAPHARPANAFGLNRASRAQGVELGLLLSEVSSPGLWVGCEAQPQDCLERAQIAARVRNISPKPTLCGTIGLARQPPIPWAWLSARERIVMPSQVVKLEVAC